MRFTVTPLGGARRDIARVVDGIVRYLQPVVSPAPAEGQPGPDGASVYYADGGEEPGRWLGVAASAAGLRGTVDREDLAAVLAGRDPRTGERLITAQGSAGRRSKLGVGNHTRTDPGGAPLFGEADAAAVLGLTHAEVARMLDVGTGVALSWLAVVPGGIPDPLPGPASTQTAASYLVPVVTAEGSRWITATELVRCQEAREDGVDPEAIAAAGDADDLFSLAEAARLAGVTKQYLRRLARYHEDHHPEIDAAFAAGRVPGRAHLVAHRGARNQWIVTRAHVAQFLERRQAPAVRVGYDVTLTTEKSLGVFAMLAGPDTCAQVLEGIQDGNDWALDWLEREAATARVGGERVPGIGWTVASFRHLTSRALDPFPHHHNVVANTVTLPDGTRRALDARGLYRHAVTASALATAEMRHQLTARLGVRWRPGRKSGWEIDGISDAVLREFSQRRNEIDDALRELEEAIGRGAHPGELEHIVLRTRPTKIHTPAVELIERWRGRAAAHGLGRDGIDACHGTATINDPDVGMMFAALAGPLGICAGGSVFTAGEAIAAIANHPIPIDGGGHQPLLTGAADLESLAHEFLASSHVVRVAGGDECLYTTVEMLRLQEGIVSRFKAGLHQGAALVRGDQLVAVLEAHSHLTDAQRDLVVSWCSGGNRFQAAVGRAGAGKTTTVAACAEAWASAGFRVIGAAVKGEAARTLAVSTDIECETVAWYVAHTDPANLPLDARTVLVVDEASTLADRDLDRLMRMAVESGATVRFIGDPAQHGAIAAGGMFRVLCERHPDVTPELRETHRLLDPHDRAAADALRDGHVDQALEHLRAAGHLHVVDDELSMYRHILARWWDGQRAGADHPMVDRRNTTRRQLNRLAHLLRRTNGEVAAVEIVASGDRRFSVGDRVTARAPSRDLHVGADRRRYVRNGALGTVTAIHRNDRSPERESLTVDFDGIGAIEVPRAFFDHHRLPSGRIEVGVDHAYAATSYAVQGSTRDVSTSRVDATTTRAEAYVDITRGRIANHLYLTAASDPLDGEALPKAPAPPVATAVAERLERSTGEMTAWELAHPDDSPAGRPPMGL